MLQALIVCTDWNRMIESSYKTLRQLLVLRIEQRTSDEDLHNQCHDYPAERLNSGKDYIDHIRKDGSFLAEIALINLCSILNCNIHVYTRQRVHTYECSDQTSNVRDVHIGFHSNHYYGSALSISPIFQLLLERSQRIKPSTPVPWLHPPVMTPKRKRSASTCNMPAPSKKYK
jgi:hypothetical protein